MVKVADLPNFDMAESLKTEEDIVMYLNMVLEENDPAELAHALGVIAKARGMTQIAKEAGIGREALYKALRQDSAPRFDTINRVVNALGLKLTVQHGVVSGNGKYSTLRFFNCAQWPKFSTTYLGFASP